MGKSADFPQLGSQGLYAAEIRGDGNCLFNALSDQIYGTQNRHREIRAAVIEYMRANADHYKAFLSVNPGGGPRRNPKRKNAASFNTTYDAHAPTQDEITRVFDAHLTQMAQGGVYGDNMEIVAFAKAYMIDVVIYRERECYRIAAANDGSTDPGTPVAHIAYHDWEHYSSIRNVNGPHTGMPEVKAAATSVGTGHNESQEQATESVIADYQVEIVANSLPEPVDRSTAFKALLRANGDVDQAVSALMAVSDEERRESRSPSSSRTVSSVERDDDDEADYKVTKRQNTSQPRGRHLVTRKGLSIRTKQSSTGSSRKPAGTESTAGSFRPVDTSSPLKREDVSTSSDDELRRDPSPTKSSDSEIDYLPPAGVRLKLTQPKPEQDFAKPASFPTHLVSRASDIRHASPKKSLQTNPLKPINTHNRDRASSPGVTKPQAGKPKKQTAAQRKDAKKLAQKQAAKERKQAENGYKPASQSQATVQSGLTVSRELGYFSAIRI